MAAGFRSPSASRSKAPKEPWCETSLVGFAPGAARSQDRGLALRAEIPSCNKKKLYGFLPSASAVKVRLVHFESDNQYG